jgi:hypothetical protein
MEVNRVDPLYYSSGQLNRGEKDNFKSDMKLLRPDGSVIDEAGYDGPFWDRTGKIFKTIKLDREYDSIKLVATLETQKGIKETKEVVYNIPINQGSSAAANTASNYGQSKISMFLIGHKILIIIVVLITAGSSVAIIATLRRKKASEMPQDTDKSE